MVGFSLSHLLKVFSLVGQSLRTTGFSVIPQNPSYFISFPQCLTFNKTFQGESQLCNSLASLLLLPLLHPRILSLAIHFKRCVFMFLYSILVVSMERITQDI